MFRYQHHEENDDKSQLPFTHNVQTWIRFWLRKRIVLAVILTVLLVSFLLASGSIGGGNNATSRDAGRRLHLIIPADKADFQLCRLMLATSILGYPTPHLVNWGQEFKSNPDDNLLADGTHLAKITGIIKWLWDLEADQMSDLVVVVDAYDITFQLPPEILIQQYYAVNKDWAERVAKQPGMRQVLEQHGIHQTVVFSADKRCSPQVENEPHCYLQPISPLAEDLYGNRTDTREGWDDDLLQAFRPRWLNSGLVMGPAKDVLATFVRAHQFIDSQLFGSDQSLFNIALAEQEFMRERWRQEALIASSKTILSFEAESKRIRSEMATFDDLPPLQKIHDVVHPASRDYARFKPALVNQQSEVHMGLDYLSKLSKTTASASHEIRLMTFNTTPPIGNLTRDARDCQTPDPVFLQSLHHVTAPFPLDFTTPEGHPPHPLRWADCPLWTDICSGTIPATIHHNGHKLNREMQWPEMWYHRYAKAFLEFRQEQARRAEAAAREKGMPVPDINDGRAWAGGKKIGFETVCPTFDAPTMVFHGCMWGHGWNCTAEEVETYAP